MSTANGEHEAILDQYNDDLEGYDKLARMVKSRLDDLVTGLGVRAQCYARVKEPESLIKKLIRHAAQGREVSLEGIGDLVGARVVVTYPQDRLTVLNAIKALFPDARMEDKKAGLGASEVGYSGVHWDVGLPNEQWESESSAVTANCEIQLQTQAERLWADLSHDLLYKGQAGQTSVPVERRANILAALCELIDNEFSAVHSQIISDMDNRPARILNLLERHYVRLSQRPYDRELSFIIMEVLEGILDDVDLNDLADRVDQFVAQNEAKLRSVYADPSRRPGDVPLLHQPESILIFMLLDGNKRRKLLRAWRDALPDRDIRALATAWGRPIPVAG